MPIVRRLWLAAAASGALTWTGRGEAKPAAGIELHWVAPARCPGPNEVRARVRRLLGSDAAGAPSREKLVAEGTVVEVGGHYRLSLTVKQSETEPAGVARVFESTSCDSLAGAAAVTLALLARGEARADGAVSPPPSDASREPSSIPESGALPASAAGSTSSSLPGSASAAPPTSSSNASSVAPAGASSVPPASSQPSSETSPPASRPPEARTGAETASAPTDAVSDQEPTATTRWSLAVRVPVFVSDEGVLPSAGYGLGLGAGVRVRRLLIMLSGVVWLSQSEAGASLYAATYQRRTGELSGCYSWQYGQFEGGPCLTTTFEDVTADGSGGGVVDRQGHVSWLTLGFGARAGWSLARWATLFLRPIVSFTTSRSTFAIDGVGPLYKVPLAAVGVQVGSEWIF